MAGISAKAGGSLANKYKYNGKELQSSEFSDGTGLETYDYGARMYNEYGRTWTIDPHADSYVSTSPYSYAASNPIRITDPTGKDIVYINQQGLITNRIVSENKEVYMAKQQVPVAGGIEGSGEIIYSKVTISMSYTGAMSESNGKMSIGNLTINATENSGQITALTTYSADSGPSLVGSIPNGDYTASSIVNTSEHGMVRDGVGFKVYLSNAPNECRTDLRIHPDGTETPGTAGCVGLTETASNLKDFKNKIEGYLKDGSTLNVNLDISKNPNLSDCKPDGKKKHNGGAAGN